MLSFAFFFGSRDLFSAQAPARRQAKLTASLLRERFPRRRDRLRDILFGVRRGDERRFELRGRQIDAASSMARKKRPNRAVSDRFADSQSVTGWSVKKNVNIEPTRFTVTPAGARGAEFGRARFELRRRFRDAP